MNNANVIAFCEKQVRINNVEGEYWFCLKDVLAALGTETKQSHIVWDDDEVLQKHPIVDNLGRSQMAQFVSEAGLYELLGKVNSVKAKPFRRWVTHDVLPSLRKTGVYVTNEHKDANYGQISEVPESVQKSAEYLKLLGYSDGILKADALERDLAHYNETGSHFLCKLALEEARDTTCKLSFNRSSTDTTKEAAVYTVADFNYMTVTELAKRYKDKRITSTLINKILEEGGYQKRIEKGKFVKTDKSKDVAIARHTQSGNTRGLDIINGWRLDNSLEHFLNQQLAKIVK